MFIYKGLFLSAVLFISCLVGLPFFIEGKADAKVNKIIPLFVSSTEVVAPNKNLMKKMEPKKWLAISDKGLISSLAKDFEQTVNGKNNEVSKKKRNEYEEAATAKEKNNDILVKKKEEAKNGIDKKAEEKLIYVFKKKSLEYEKSDKSGNIFSEKAIINADKKSELTNNNLSKTTDNDQIIKNSPTTSNGLAEETVSTGESVPNLATVKIGEPSSQSGLTTSPASEVKNIQIVETSQAAETSLIEEFVPNVATSMIMEPLPAEESGLIMLPFSEVKNMQTVETSQPAETNLMEESVPNTAAITSMEPVPEEDTGLTTFTVLEGENIDIVETSQTAETDLIEESLPNVATAMIIEPVQEEEAGSTTLPVSEVKNTQVVETGLNAATGTFYMGTRGVIEKGTLVMSKLEDFNYFCREDLTCKDERYAAVSAPPVFSMFGLGLIGLIFVSKRRGKTDISSFLVSISTKAER